jgi:hypothetical protein
MVEMMRGMSRVARIMAVPSVSSATGHARHVAHSADRQRPAFTRDQQRIARAPTLPSSVDSGKYGEHPPGEVGERPGRQGADSHEERDRIQPARGVATGCCSLSQLGHRAHETRVPLATVRKRLAELGTAGGVVMLQLIRYEGSKSIEAWQCRVSGYVPAPAPGRKPKAA